MLEEHDVELPGGERASESLEAGPVLVGPAERLVAEDLGDDPALPLGMDEAFTQLVVDGCWVLQIAGKPRIDGHALWLL